MPTAGVFAIAALGAAGYLFIGQPIVRGVKKAEKTVVHLVHKPKKDVKK